ncbi:MAG: exonuclease [Bacillus sp. (in: Bacteria)]|nr:exonuclease [Bacillus sp. (in: firmicutes)]
MLKKSRFFSWSTSDLTRLKIDAGLHGIPDTTVRKIEKRYIDFQGIFTKRVTKNNPSVENALTFYGMSFVGEKHNPMFDAFNTLRIYLSFLSKAKETDLLMVRHFITENVPNCMEELNQSLSKMLFEDLHSYALQLQEMYRIKDASRILKKTRQLVEKYENVLINRSGIFSKEIVANISLLLEFYHELLLCYDDHVSHSSKVMILDETLFYPFEQLSLKRG